MVRSVCLNADGRQLLSSSQDGEVRLWGVGTGACHQVMTVDVRLGRDDPFPVRFGRYGEQAVVAGPDSAIRSRDLHTGGPPQELQTFVWRTPQGDMPR